MGQEVEFTAKSASISNMVLGGESRETDQAPTLFCNRRAVGADFNEEFRTRENSRVRKPPLCEETIKRLTNTSGDSTNQVFRLKADQREHCQARLETVSKF